MLEFIPYTLEEILFFITEIVCILIEYWGLLLIIITIVNAIKACITKHKFNFEEMVKDNHINKGLSAALEVLLAGEIAKTIISVNKQDLINIILLVIIRVGITVVLHWEGTHKGEHHTEEKKTKTTKKTK